MITPKALRKLYDKAELQVWLWADVKVGDELAHLAPGSQIFCIQVTGTFGGAGISMDGSLDETTFGAMPRALGETSIIKNSDIVSFSGPVAWVRPRLIGGDETTQLNIMLSAVQK